MSPTLIKYLKNLIENGNYTETHDYLCTVPIREAYGFVKALKHTHNKLFFKWASNTCMSKYGSKKLFIKVLKYYEKNNLECCHPVEKGKEPLWYYIRELEKD